MSDPARKSRSGLGLGRGLDALMGELRTEGAGAPAFDSEGSIRVVPTSALAPHPFQPRRRFDEAALDELASSIAEHGILQPIVVRPSGQTFQIVAGERRWRAAQRARLHEVPVVLRTLDDAETLQIAIIENIQREDLNVIEEAEAYRRLIEEFGHTQEALATIVHKSRSHVTNLLRLLSLPDDVRAHVLGGRLSMGHARALIGVEGAQAFAEQIIARGLSVRQAEQLARGVKRGEMAQSYETTSRSDDPDIAALERQLGELLGLKVTIVQRGAEGSITLTYSTLDQLDFVCQRLSGDTI